jgi:hypothetical protein
MQQQAPVVCARRDLRHGEAVKVLAGLCVLWTGCFYLDPLNKPPNLRFSCELPDDRECDQDSPVHRGDRVQLRMRVSDPDGNADPSSYGWKASACKDEHGSMCDPEPFDAQHYDEGAGMGVEVEIPTTIRAEIHTISIDFEARDDRGGINPPLSLVLQLTDAPNLPFDAADARAAPGSGTMYVRGR